MATLGRAIKAEVILRPGNLDVTFAALEISVAGLQTPYHFILQMPAIGYKALAEQANPVEVYEAIAKAINASPLAKVTGAAAAA